MSDISNGAAVSAPTSTPSPSSAPSSSQPSSVPTSSPLRQTTAELSDRLQEATPNEVPADSQHSNWYDKYSEGIHGVPVQELLEAISNGQLPDALHDKISLSLRDGDREWQGDIATLRNGAMMREKFSQVQNQLAEERRAFFSERDQFIEDLRSVQSDPQQFLYSMQQMGMPVLEAAKALATQFATRDYLNRQAGVDPNSGQRGPGDDWFDGIQASQELAAMKRAQERYQQNSQEQQAKQQFNQRSQAVQGAAIEAFKQAQIDFVKYPQYWDRAAMHLQRIYDAKPEPRDGSEKPLTRGDVRRAVGLVKQEIDAFLRDQKIAPASNGRPGAAALDNRSGSRPSARAPQQPSQQRKTTEEIAREMRERQGVRIR